MRTALLLAVLALCTACVDKKKAEEKKPEEPVPTPVVGSPSAASLPVRLNVKQCEEILVDGEKQLAQERLEATKSCEVDAECAVVLSGVCIPSCPDFAMNKMQSMAYMQRHNEIDATTCKKWRDGDCKNTTPKPPVNCTAMKGVCQNKQCVAVTK